ncbi:uncharacterized protein LOC118994936 [Sturnira hondurensis]|uniref:uncharacterized protein LOC118994936 n=1 Tax=Sturnira hondurensis TaxID=192404 RepID=UPI0018795724|nr:uncharacterized protein LOC118994936 [Sturnira hondurensis]
MCYPQPQPASGVLRNAVCSFFSSAQKLCGLDGEQRTELGQKGISEPCRGAQPLPAFLGVFRILLSVGASSPTGKSGGFREERGHKPQPGLPLGIRPRSADSVPCAALGTLSLSPHNSRTRFSTHVQIPLMELIKATWSLISPPKLVNLRPRFLLSLPGITVAFSESLQSIWFQCCLGLAAADASPLPPGPWCTVPRGLHREKTTLVHGRQGSPEA